VHLIENSACFLIEEFIYKISACGNNSPVINIKHILIIESDPATRV